MPSLSSPPNVWESVKSDFKSLFPEDVFKLWFEPVVCVESNDDVLTLGVPNDFAAIWIHDNYLDLIVQRLRLSTGKQIAVKLKKVDLGSSSQPPFNTASSSNDAFGSRTKSAPPARRAVRYDERAASQGSLNPRNTF